jgi:hypothetical protein
VGKLTLLISLATCLRDSRAEALEERRGLTDAMYVSETTATRGDAGESSCLLRS